MTKSSVWSRWGVASLSALLLTACPLKLGDDDDGKDGGTADKPAQNDGVDANRDAKTLSTDEAQRVCEAVTSGETAEQRCTLAGLRVGGTQSTCEQIKMQCLSQSVKPAQQNECEGAEVASDLRTCAAVTIGEIKDCFSQIVAAERKLTCADVGKPPPQPPCVMTLAARCPDLFDDMVMPPAGDRDSDGGVAQPMFPVPDGGIPGGTPGQCPSGTPPAGSPTVNCNAFCSGITAPKCTQGPMLEQCLGGCELAKIKCPATINALNGCATNAAAKDLSWSCDPQGRPFIPGACGMELGCFGTCLGTGGTMTMPPMQPMQPMP